MTIPVLIDKFDTVEIVRDEITAILAAEIASQKALATNASKDPRLWTLRIFSERTSPWSEYQSEPETVDAFPIVNVWFDNLNFERNASNVVSCQKASAVFNVDVYAYGKSADVFNGGHTPGDRLAAYELHRAVRLVRNILMAAEYTYLGLQGTVWGRWIDSITSFQPAIDANQVQQIQAARIAFRVEFNELSPQGEEAYDNLDLVAVTVKRTETGEVYFDAHYD